MDLRVGLLHFFQDSLDSQAEKQWAEGVPLPHPCGTVANPEARPEAQGCAMAVRPVEEGQEVGEALVNRRRHFTTVQSVERVCEIRGEHAVGIVVIFERDGSDLPRPEEARVQVRRMDYDFGTPRDAHPQVQRG